jgi:hypothetical protein
MLDLIYTIWAWVQAIPIIVTLCSAITAMTPTPMDDKLWGKIYKWIDFCAINIGKAKEQAGIK